MPFEWPEYLVLAKALLARDSEAEWRSAISRAYYAVFNQAKQLAGRPATSEGSHDAVWNEMERRAERRWVAAAKHGQRLKRERVRADYSNSAVNRREAEAAVQIAETLVRQLEDIRRASAP